MPVLLNPSVPNDAFERSGFPPLDCCLIFFSPQQLLDHAVKQDDLLQVRLTINTVFVVDHVWAVPRTNRTSSIARNPIACATSSTSERPAYEPWQLWRFYDNSMVGGNTFGALVPQVSDDVGTPFSVVLIPVNQNLFVHDFQRLRAAAMFHAPVLHTTGQVLHDY